MADPREVTVERRRKLDHLSPLMRAKALAKSQEVVNACPYGCGLRQMDEHGYCRHLVGFSFDGKKYEPMVRKGGRRVVQVEMEPDPEQAVGEDGEPVLRPKLPEVRADDKLVRITVCSRVYRDVDGMGAKLAARQAEEAARKRLEEKRELIEELKADPDFRLALLAEVTAPVGGAE